MPRWPAARHENRAGRDSDLCGGFVGLYIDLESDAATHVLERADFAPQRVLRDAKEAIEPPTAA